MQKNIFNSPQLTVLFRCGVIGMEAMFINQITAQQIHLNIQTEKEEEKKTTNEFTKTNDLINDVLASSD